MIQTFLVIPTRVFNTGRSRGADSAGGDSGAEVRGRCGARRMPMACLSRHGKSGQWMVLRVDSAGPRRERAHAHKRISFQSLEPSLEAGTMLAVSVDSDKCFLYKDSALR